MKGRSTDPLRAARCEGRAEDEIKLIRKSRHDESQDTRLYCAPAIFELLRASIPGIAARKIAPNVEEESLSSPVKLNIARNNLM